jgi:hypothetical protein
VPTGDESDFQLRIVAHTTVLERLRTEDDTHLIEKEKRYFGKRSFRAALPKSINRPAESCGAVYGL